MSPTNGFLAIAIPLYRLQHEESLGKMEGYSLQLTNGKPLAYVVDVNQGRPQILNAEWVEKNLEFLGDL